MINKRSILGFNIQINEIDKIKYSFYVSKKISEPVARILSTRSVVNEKNFNDFLDPKIKNLLPHPFELKDCEDLCKILDSVILDNKKIGIIADYDVDGSSSAALLDLYFNAIGFKNFIIHIPNRITEGYGVSKSAIDKLALLDCKILLSLDCGVTAFEAIDYANSKGLDFLVIDHHKQDELNGLPMAKAIVNPNRTDDESGLTYLCACGVLWVVLIGLNIVLEQNNYFKIKQKPDLMQYLDIVAVASVCDVMSMEGLNRAFYKKGLELISSKSHKGLAVLLEKLNVTSISNGTIGYKIGPVVNAGGRLAAEKSEFLGYNILKTKEFNDEIFSLTNKAIECNLLRMEIELDILEDIKINEEDINKDGFVFIYYKTWHEGLIGIIASRLKDKYHMPVFVGFINENNEIKMSARSVDEIDIGDIIINAVNKGILIKGGGHKKAGGLSLELKNVDLFRNFVKESIASVYVNKVKFFDSIIVPTSVNEEFLDFLSKLEPFGINNAKPLFLFTGFILDKIEEREKMYTIHLTARNTFKKFRATLFKRSFDNVAFLSNYISKEIEFLGNIEKNNGYINILIEDFVEN